MRSLELFSGAGGLAKGLEISGFRHVAFVECNKDACASLRQNFHAARVFEGDVRHYDFSKISDIDVVAGGPPCQPFSFGGKHRASDDVRDMFPYAIQAIETLKPKAFIFENVKGLLRPSFQDYFKYILARLSYPEVPADGNWRDHLNRLHTIKHTYFQGVKYNVCYKLINAADYGVPQIRERVIIVGIRSDLERHWVFPEPTHSKETLLWQQEVSGGYWAAHGIKTPEKCCATPVVHTDLFAPTLLPWRTVRDALRNVPDPTVRHAIPDHIFRDGARVYPGHTGSTMDWPAKTIKAGGHGVPGGENMLRYENGKVRYLTVYEAKLLQTFPPDFIISGSWGEALRQIGNAVPVLLAETMGEHLMKTLQTSLKKHTETAHIGLKQAMDYTNDPHF